MVRSVRLATVLLGIPMICLTSGCITVNSPSGLGSWRPLQKQNVQQVVYEQEEEVPRKVQDPTRLKLMYARLMEDSGQAAEARKHYYAITDSDPDNVHAILGLARLEQMTGETAEAERGFQRAVKLAPQSAEAQFGLGQFYTAQENWEQSVQPLTKAMLAAPDNTQYRYSLAVALVEVGDVDSALPHFIRTVGDAEAHYNVGLLLKDKGDLAGAERHFLLAVTKKPDLESAQNWLDSLREQRQKVETASQTAPPPSRHIVPASREVFHTPRLTAQQF